MSAADLTTVHLRLNVARRLVVIATLRQTRLFRMAAIVSKPRQAAIYSLTREQWNLIGARMTGSKQTIT